MNKLKRYNKKIVMSTVALILAATAFIASVCYAWFTANKSRTDSTVVSVSGGNIIFDSTVTALKHYYSDEEDKEVETTYTYTIENNVIKNENSEQKDKNGYPLFSNLSSGEWVDITIGFYASDSSLIGNSYTLTLSDFAVDDESTTDESSDESSTYYNANRKYSFRLIKDTKYLSPVYGVLGVFKWGIVNVTEETHKVDDNGMTYFHSEDSYFKNKTDANIFDYYTQGTTDDVSDDKTDSGYSVNIATGTIDSTDTTRVTFRIMVDTTDYSRLLSGMGADSKGENNNDSNTDYLLNKEISIGLITVTVATKDATDNNGESSDI